MEKTFTKYFWAVNLVTLALIAFFMASGTGELVADTVTKMLPTSSKTSRAPRVAPRKTTRVLRPSGDIVLERNIFDSITGAITDMPEMDVDAPVIAADGELPIVPCTGGTAKLLATVAAAGDPDWSFANVQTGSEKDLYRIGDELDGRVVSGITWRYILLRGSSDECYIDMFGDQEAIKKIKKPGPKKPTGDAIADGIQVDSEFERTVDRSVVDQALANPTAFAKSVRVRPYKRNGKVVGFRLRRVKKGSPLELLGAQKGDIIHSVNGVELTSVDQALTAYQGLRNDNKLTFNVTRKGKPVDLNINIR